jgi:hypothetical protein
MGLQNPRELSDVLRDAILKLRFIDADEFLRAGLPSEELNNFQARPAAWFAMADEDDRAKLWEIIKPVTSRLGIARPGVARDGP